MPPGVMVTELECLRCHAVYDDQRLFTGCPRCAKESVNVNLSVKLPTAELGPLTPESFPATPRSLWRFSRLLPMGDAAPVSLGEGATPLVRPRAARPSPRPAPPLREGREPEPDVVVQGPAVLARRHPRRGHWRARDHHLVDGQSRRLHGGLRRAGGAAMRHLHPRLRARHDEDAHAGLRRRRRRVLHVRVALGADARGHRALRLVSDERVGHAAHRLQPVRRRGLQDHRVRDRRGPRLDGARHRRRAELLQRRPLRHLERAGPSSTRWGW